MKLKGTTQHDDTDTHISNFVQRRASLTRGPKPDDEDLSKLRAELFTAGDKVEGNTIVEAPAAAQAKARQNARGYDDTLVRPNRPSVASLRSRVSYSTPDF